MLRNMLAGLVPHLALGLSVVSAQVSTPDEVRATGLDSLHTVLQAEGVPLPTDIGSIVKDIGLAEKLGKALFYDMAVGSDGVQACATCHFQAGADVRTRNQVSPDLTRVKNLDLGGILGFSEAAAAADEGFETKRPNEQLRLADFPFVKDIGSGDNLVEVNGVLEPAYGNSNDVAASQGVRRMDYVRTAPGAHVDTGVSRPDPVFHQAGKNARRVEPRNTPTTINAVLNLFNFWDGRANPIFNGVNPFGVQDPGARIWVAHGNSLQQERLALDVSSLASQAVGPPQSHFEMSFGDGADNVRPFPDIGRKLLGRRALALQRIAHDDSLLGALRHPTGKGLTKTYAELVRAAFEPRYWHSNMKIYYPPYGDPIVVGPNSGYDPKRTYSLMEANFSLFYGLAVQLFERTQISDRAPFDHWMEGDGSEVPGFGDMELAGMNVFLREGCNVCHSGPEFTSASIRSLGRNGERLTAFTFNPLGEIGIEDFGFFNLSVTPITDDLGRGGVAPNGEPLSSARQMLAQAQGLRSIPHEITGAPHTNAIFGGFIPLGGDLLGAFNFLTGTVVPICNDLDADGACGPQDNWIMQRVAVDGTFKAPTLRNVLLTGPYFHNGSAATLREVVQFYNRGGNFCRTNVKDHNFFVAPLGMTDEDEVNLVAFLIALTDERVMRESAPFDRPALALPHGQTPDGRSDTLVQLAEVGRYGRPYHTPLAPFLRADPFDANPVDGNDLDANGKSICLPLAPADPE